VPTYNAEIVIGVPPAGDERKLMEAFGRKVCELIIQSGDVPPGERHRRVEQEARDLIAGGVL
jgi:hypothetical protein